MKKCFWCLVIPLITIVFVCVFSVSIPKAYGIDDEDFIVELSPIASITNDVWDTTSTAITGHNSRINGVFSFSQTIDVPDNNYTFLTLDIFEEYDLELHIEVEDEFGNNVDSVDLSTQLLDTNCGISVRFNYVSGSTPLYGSVSVYDKNILKNLIAEWQSTYVILENPYPDNIVESILITAYFPFSAFDIGVYDSFDNVSSFHMYTYRMNINLYQDLYSQGWVDGYNQGFSEGYQEAIGDLESQYGDAGYWYNKGRSDAIKESDGLIKVIPTALGSIWLVVSDFLSFTVLGINVWSILIIIAAFGLIILLIKILT